MTTHTAFPLHRLDRTRLPVVVMGGINLVRTLGLAGLQAIVATSDAEEPALRSRYCSAGVHLPPADQHDARVEALVGLGRKLAGIYGCRLPLMYGSDDALELIYARRDRLGRYYLFLMSDPEVADALFAKDRFDALARARGLPVPPSLAWDGDGPGSVRAARGEVVVKPRIKVGWHHSRLCQRLFSGDAKALVFPSGAAAAADPGVSLHHRQLVFQEFIPGDDRDLWSFHGLADERGEVLQCFVGRKVRTYPAGNGESAFIELAHDEGLEAAGREVARRCPLRGVFKMDFKRDPRDGRWYLLEINARFSLWHYIGAVNGVNLMRATYDYLVRGEQPPRAAYATRVRWLSLGLDYRAFRQLRAAGKLGTARWIGSILASRNVYNLFSWNDPRPFAALAARRLTRKWRSGTGALGAALRQWRSTAS